MRKCAFIMMVLAAMVQSCIYPYTPDVPESSDSMLVIDGDITIGEKCSFSARMILPLDYEGDTGLTFVDEAVFTVEHDSGISYTATQGMNDSQATIDLTSAPAKGSYRLTVKVLAPFPAGEFATPWMEVIPAPVIGELEERVFDSDQDRVLDRLSLAINLSAENSSGCFSWDYDELFYFHTLLSPPEQEYKNGMIIDHSEDYSGWWKYSYCWKETHSRVTGIAIARAMEGWNLYSHQFLDIPLTAQQLDQNEYYIRFKAKTIPEGKYRFLDALNRGSDGPGSLLSPLPGEVFGNIRSTDDTTVFAFGYVTANIVAKKILKVKTQGFKNTVYPSQYYYDPYFDPSMNYFEANIRAYKWGYLPYKRDDNGQLWWVKNWCVDCTADGGTLDKPSGWTND